MLASPKATNAYLLGTNGSLVSRSARLLNGQQIAIDADSIVHDGAVIDAAAAAVSIGRGSVIGSGTMLQPPAARRRNDHATKPLRVGEECLIGACCTIRGSVGDRVRIGKGCVVGERSALGEGCELPDGVSLPSDTIVPPRTVVRRGAGQGSGTELQAVKLPPEAEAALLRDVEAVRTRFRARMRTHGANRAAAADSHR